LGGSRPPAENWLWFSVWLLVRTAIKTYLTIVIGGEKHLVEPLRFSLGIKSENQIGSYGKK
jgi:hypothetical protein